MSDNQNNPFFNKTIFIGIYIFSSICASILSWKCNSNESFFMRSLYAIFAYIFSFFYILYYIIYRIIFNKNCNSENILINNIIESEKNIIESEKNIIESENITDSYNNTEQEYIN
jgi:hypothetical protein